ncbi:MAG: hypothetical protein M1835_005457 [Candelina submexicana]|nr:MAG: hypothetical protein M1835_005457 [Candelina submexicana]
MSSVTSQGDAGKLDSILAVLEDIRANSVVQTAILERIWSCGSVSTLDHTKHCSYATEYHDNIGSNAILPRSKRAKYQTGGVQGVRTSTRSFPSRKRGAKASQQARRRLPISRTNSIVSEDSSSTLSFSGSSPSGSFGYGSSLFRPSLSRPASASEWEDVSDAGFSTTTSSEASFASSSPFLRLPTELRLNIYKHLLVTSAVINNPLDSLKQSQNRRKAPVTIPGLDAVILQTCRSIYQEAVPILYGDNRFRFMSGISTEMFATSGMSVSPWHETGPSRLKGIRSMDLIFCALWQCGQPNRIAGLQKDSDTWIRQGRALSFPSLRDLALDFTEWELTSRDYFPEEMTDWLKALLTGVEVLTLKGLQYQPDVIGSLASVLVLPATLTLDLSHLGIGVFQVQVTDKVMAAYNERRSGKLTDLEIFGFDSEIVLGLK